MNKKLKTLIEMHMYCRPMGSLTERNFIEDYIADLPNAECDPHGNWHVNVDDAPVLWSSHLDTVHWKEGIQEVHYNKRSGLLTLPKGSKSSCLGADCTAGVFLMREMILAKVPGHYVFHHGEERGCIGSGKLALLNEKFLSQFKFAIALDRGGTTDVITHQSYGRTASDEFALSMCKQLGGYYKPSDEGVYTDTNEYPDIIAECSNISVGYTRQHSSAETLDTRHLFALLAKLKKIKIDKLVCARVPGEGGWDDRWSLKNYDYPTTSDSGKTVDFKEVLRADRLNGLTKEEGMGRLFREAEALDRRYEGFLQEEERKVTAESDFLTSEWEEVQVALRQQGFGTFWPPRKLS